jgi:hypothetical protein
MRMEAGAMTIQITNPEVEALINQRLRSGGFKDAQDVVWQALHGVSKVLDARQKAKELRLEFEVLSKIWQRDTSIFL